MTPRALPGNGERRDRVRVRAGGRVARGSGPAAAAAAARIPHFPARARPQGLARGPVLPSGRRRSPSPEPPEQPAPPGPRAPPTAMASESVKVVVRCRPMNQRERELHCQPVVTVDSARGQCFIQNPGAADEPPKQFTFDGAYHMEHFTEQIYNEIAYPLVEVRAPAFHTGGLGLGPL